MISLYVWRKGVRLAGCHFYDLFLLKFIIPGRLLEFVVNNSFWIGNSIWHRTYSAESAALIRCSCYLLLGPMVCFWSWLVSRITLCLQKYSCNINSTSVVMKMPGSMSCGEVSLTLEGQYTNERKYVWCILLLGLLDAVGVSILTTDHLYWMDC